MESLKILINIVGIFLGWVVVHYLSVRREKEKEKRQLAEKTIGLIEELEKIAIDYHLHDGRLEASETDIWRLFAQIERYLSRMRLDRNKDETLYLIALRQAIMYENFGPDYHGPQMKDSKIIREIRVAADKIIAFLDTFVIKIC